MNVYAGAYDLLKKDGGPPNGTWSNEQGYELLSPATTPEQGNWAQRGIHYVGEGTAKAAGDVLPIRTTHNKDEHDRDTWVRHRWLGDFGQVWEQGDVERRSRRPAAALRHAPARSRSKRTGDVAGLGTTVGHRVTDVTRGIGRMLPGDDTKNKRGDGRGPPRLRARERRTRWLLEEAARVPVALLRRGAARHVRAVHLRPRRRQDERRLPRRAARPEGAGPGGGAADEGPGPPRSASKEQVKRPPPASGFSEKRKLQFFSTERNQATSPSSWNYLNFISCPNLSRLVRFGREAFYERSAFPPFAAKGVRLAVVFAGELAQAYGKPGSKLAKLAQFWNLDTGLGLRVQTVAPADRDRHEVVTRIDWIHALGPTGANEELAYVCRQGGGYLEKPAEPNEPYPLRGWRDAQRAFPTYDHAPFENLGAVVEEAGVLDPPRYLAELRLQHPLAAKETAPSSTGSMGRTRRARTRSSRRGSSPTTAWTRRASASTAAPARR